MNQQLTKSLITYINLKYYGVDIEKSYWEGGKNIAEKLIKNFGENKKYVIISGLGGNGAVGIATGLFLAKLGAQDVRIYIIGRINNIVDSTEKIIFNKVNEEILNNKYSNLYIKQDCYSKDIVKGDIIIECLVGTGIEEVNHSNKLKKRFQDVINRISHFNSLIIAMDLAAPSYTPDKIYSLMYPKDERAEVINLNIPNDINIYCGPGEVKYLFIPKKYTHKNKNGKLLYISSTKENKSLEQIITMARQYEVFVYIYNFNQNILNLDILSKEDTKYFYLVKDTELKIILSEVDSIVYGSFDDENLLNESLLKELLNINKIQILNQFVMKFNIKDESKNFVLILNKNETLKQDRNNEFPLKAIAFEKKINLINISLNITLYNYLGDFKISTSSISLKEKYSQLLANLIAILSTKNDLWLAMKASTFILELANQVDGNYNNIANHITEAIDWCREFS